MILPYIKPEKLIKNYLHIFSINEMEKNNKENLYRKIIDGYKSIQTVNSMNYEVDRYFNSNIILSTYKKDMKNILELNSLVRQLKRD